MGTAFQLHDQGKSDYINQIFSNLIKDINDNLNQILQSVIVSAESLELFIQQESDKNSRGKNKVIIKTTETLQLRGTSEKNHDTLLFSHEKYDKKQNNLVSDLKNKDTEIRFLETIKEEKEITRINSDSDKQVLDTEELILATEIVFNQTGNRKDRPKGKYECNQCSHVATDKGNLSKHIKVVHLKIRNYECENCSKTFSTMFNLKDHAERKHGNLKNNRSSKK